MSTYLTITWLSGGIPAEDYEIQYNINTTSWNSPLSVTNTQNYNDVTQPKSAIVEVPEMSEGDIVRFRVRGTRSGYSPSRWSRASGLRLITLPVSQTLDATDIEVSSVTLTGDLSNISNKGITVEYYFRYREVGSSQWSTTPIGSTTSDVLVQETITGLNFFAIFEFQLVAYNTIDKSTTTVTGNLLNFETFDENPQFTPLDIEKQASLVNFKASITEIDESLGFTYTYGWEYRQIGDPDWIPVTDPSYEIESDGNVETGFLDIGGIGEYEYRMFLYNNINQSATLEYSNIIQFDNEFDEDSYMLVEYGTNHFSTLNTHTGEVLQSSSTSENSNTYDIDRRGQALLLGDYKNRKLTPDLSIEEKLDDDFRFRQFSGYIVGNIGYLIARKTDEFEDLNRAVISVNMDSLNTLDGEWGFDTNIYGRFSHLNYMNSPELGDQLYFITRITPRIPMGQDPVFRLARKSTNINNGTIGELADQSEFEIPRISNVGMRVATNPTNNRIHVSNGNRIYNFYPDLSKYTWEVSVPEGEIIIGLECDRLGNAYILTTERLIYRGIFDFSATWQIPLDKPAASISVSRTLNSYILFRDHTVMKINHSGNIEWETRLSENVDKDGRIHCYGGREWNKTTVPE